MTPLLIALALAAASGLPEEKPQAIVKAQSSSEASIRAMGDWGQGLIAAQQPAIDAFQRCAPMVEQMTAAVRSAEAGIDPNAQALLPGMRACLAEARIAALASRDRLASMQPIPARLERVIGVDSRDILRRSAAATGEIATYIGLVEEAIDAAVAGDEALSEQKWRESRMSAAGAMDAQILILEALRAGLPLQTHKAMIDIRLNINRAVRLITIAETEDERTAAGLRQFGAAQRSAAAEMRRHWRRERPLAMASLASFPTSVRTSLANALDTAINNIIQAGENTATVLEGARDQSGEAQLIEIVGQLAAAEVHILETVREMSAAMSQVN